MPLACHMDLDLQDRLFKLLQRPSRQPRHWTVPIKPCDLKRLMASAGIEPVGGFFDGEVYRPEDQIAAIKNAFARGCPDEPPLTGKAKEPLNGQPYGPESRVIPPHPEKPL